jgi:hypothetical protein
VRRLLFKHRVHARRRAKRRAHRSRHRHHHPSSIGDLGATVAVDGTVAGLADSTMGLVQQEALRGIPGGEQCAVPCRAVPCRAVPASFFMLCVPVCDAGALLRADAVMVMIKLGLAVSCPCTNNIDPIPAAVVTLLQTLSAAATPPQRATAQRPTQLQHSGCLRWLGSMQRSCLGSGWRLTGTVPGSWGQARLVWLVHQACLAAACLACTSRRPGRCLGWPASEVAGQ